jgi:hypothetical protein
VFSTIRVFIAIRVINQKIKKLHYADAECVTSYNSIGKYFMCWTTFETQKPKNWAVSTWVNFFASIWFLCGFLQNVVGKMLIFYIKVNFKKLIKLICLKSCYYSRLKNRTRLIILAFTEVVSKVITSSLAFNDESLFIFWGLRYLIN